MMTSVVYYSCMFTVKHLLWLMNYRSTEELDQFRFLHAVCLANLKGSVGLILAKVSDMRISIPFDLSSRPFFPLTCFSDFVCLLFLQVHRETLKSKCGMLRWGDRDILQPSDLTREKKKRKYLRYYFSFICAGWQFSILGTEGWVKVRPGLVLRHYGKTKMWRDQVMWRV